MFAIAIVVREERGEHLHQSADMLLELAGEDSAKETVISLFC